MKQSTKTILTIANVVPLVGSVYYFCPGFEHLGTSGTGAQPTLGALCIMLFLIAFCTAVQLAPKRQ